MKRNVACKFCGDDNWTEEKKYRQLNANGEYVDGFGHRPYFVPGETEWWCSGCGGLEGGNPARITPEDKPT